MKSFVRLFWVVLAAGAAISATPSVHAALVAGDALIDPALMGNTETSVWTNLSSIPAPGVPGQTGNGTVPGLSGTGSFPGSTMWGPQATQGGGGDSELVKLSNGTGGGPYGASGSMYFGGFSGDINNNGGTLAVADSTPLANVQEVAFQVQIGEAWTYDFYNNAAPYLVINGIETAEATTSSILEQYFNGTVTMPTGEEDVYINTYLFKWDLSDYAGEITSLSAIFTGVQHAQLYALRIDQSDYVPSATHVPEPGTLALLGCGLLIGIPMKLRRSRKSVA